MPLCEPLEIFLSILPQIPLCLLLLCVFNFSVCVTYSLAGTWVWFQPILPFNLGEGESLDKGAPIFSVDRYYHYNHITT